jgi:hypothetical protein
MTAETDPFLTELHTVEENCLYTAQAHFAMASRKGTVVKVIYISAAVVSAIGGCLVAGGLPKWLGALPALGGVVGAVISAIGVDRNVHAHLIAANALTKLRHEARALRETFSKAMSSENLARETRRSTEAYNNMIQGLPPTDESAMKTARAAIQAGRFDPDFRSAGAGTRALPSGQSLHDS